MGIQMSTAGSFFWVGTKRLALWASRTLGFYSQKSGGVDIVTCAETLVCVLTILRMDKARLARFVHLMILLSPRSCERWTWNSPLQVFGNNCPGTLAFLFTLSDHDFLIMNK
jgi:hypothetical protein